MEKPDERVMDRIRKLLSRTTAANCTPAEAEQAFARASVMMATHNLSMADVKCENDPQAFIEEVMFNTDRWTTEDNLAYGIIKEFFFVDGFLNRNSGGKAFTLFGTQENVSIAKFTWNALLSAFSRQWNIYRIPNRIPNTQRNLFLTGMASGFRSKMSDERKAMAAERDLARGSSGGTALALRDINADITKALYETHSYLKPSKGTIKSPTGDQKTLEAGIKAGKSLNLRRAVGQTTGSSKAIGGSK